jgi:5-methylcytosine-specific restriction endonuclease McrA
MTRNYQDPEYKKWRAYIYRRDKFQCQWPYCKQKNKLHAHHIHKWADFPGLRYHTNNGITLCKTHHDLIKNNEESYAPFFLKLLLNKDKK